MLGDAPVIGSRRQARRFRPGLDYTLATPGAPWELKRGAKSGGAGGGRDRENAVKSAASPNKGTEENSSGKGRHHGENGTGEHEAEEGGEKREGGEKKEGGEEEEEYMVLDVVLCFVDDREPYKEAAWRQDEVGGYVTYLGGDDEDADKEDTPVPPQQGKGNGGSSSEGGGGSGSGSGGRGVKQGEPSSSSSSAPEEKANGGGKNDAAVYKADEGGSLVSVSAASNTLSLVLRDDAGIASFVKYLSSAAPGSRFDVMGEYLVVGGESDSEDEDYDQDGDNYSSEGEGGVGVRTMLETVPEGEEEEEEEEDKGGEGGEGGGKRGVEGWKMMGKGNRATNDSGNE